MSVLSSGLRSVLERAIGEGRAAAERGAVSSLSRLGIADVVAPPYLSSDEVSLRDGLLARALQLGDSRVAGPVADAVPLLVGEVAYEQWHRLLFARFLAVNNLLMHPEYGATVSLDECADLAVSLGEPDGWAVASRFAAQILPGIFRLDDPAVQVQLAPEDRLALEKIVTGLPAEVFTADDALGWVYQYWQSKQKQLVNDSGRKIGGADISPVTQLFTEDYMVRFLLENSLGAWWAARNPDSALVADLEYLRFDESGDPAAGSFEGWPASVDQVTVMDPCCGSGHFLVAAFGMLWRMRAEAEALTPADAQDAVLRDNLFGLELDPRCTQIAMFNLALEAWKQGGYRVLPVLNVACSGIPAKAPLEAWTILAEDAPQLEDALTRLHDMFKDADTLGSLIDPRRAAENDDLLGVDWDVVSPLLMEALDGENGTDRPALSVYGRAAADTARAAHFLSDQYTLLVTNPPYLGRGKFGAVLGSFIDSEFPNERNELAAAFTSRMARSVRPGGHVVVVVPQNLLYLTAHKKFRIRLLEDFRLSFAITLGEHGFSSPAAAGAFVALISFARDSLSGESSLILTDASSGRSPQEKREELLRSPLTKAFQSQVMANPDYRIAKIISPGGSLLRDYAYSYAGIQSGDIARFGRAFWEIPRIGQRWRRLQGTVRSSTPYAGRENILMWDEGRGELYDYVVEKLGANGVGAWLRGIDLEKPGVVVSSMRHLPITLSTQDLFDNNCAVVVPNNVSDLPALWAFMKSEEYAKLVRAIDPKLNVTNSTLAKVPFDLERWRKIAAEEYPEGLPAPLSNDPTQWLFNGEIPTSSEPLQVAIARLLGYSWPDQSGDDLESLADEDGIVVLPPVAGEKSAAERVRALLARSHGARWSTSKLDSVLNGAQGKAGDLEGWLRDSYFKHHARTFNNRPFIWHIWDGRADGFSVLINYHRLGRRTLEKLTYTTLGWWIQKQRDDAAKELPGAGARLAAAEKLKVKLELILEGEPPYDIFVRWKSLAEQPIGWDPDLDDGVRMNIRPFVEAGILRSKFTINWNKDRGTNPDGSLRFNNLHFTNAEKYQARKETD
jgi:hypothetical protein